MNRERWKNAWVKLKGSIEHHWGQRNDEMSKPLAKIQAAISQRLRTMLGTKEETYVSNAAIDSERAPLAAAPFEPTRDLHAVRDQHANGG